MDNSIIVVDDELDFLQSVKRGLVTYGYQNVTLEQNPHKAVALFEKGANFDIALIDINMPDLSGVELLEMLKKISPGTECIMVTAVDEARVAVSCLKKGAYDYLVKPFSREDLISSIDRALERKRLVDLLDLGKTRRLPGLKNPEAFKTMITNSPKVLKIFKEAELHAQSNAPILITGESGTGKELLAKAIHAASPRAKFPFTPINMASLTGSIFDAEFYGHTKGAFTGADKNRMGYLEQSNRGSLFLDEIGSLSAELQGKLLRTLQDGEYMKLGTSIPQKADVRFIAATNSDLEMMVARKTFRQDLYYRLRGGWIHLPPLKERSDDIPLLIQKFLEEFGGAAGKDGMEESALALLLNYDYPGNIRELRYIIQAAVNLSQGKPISVEVLPAEFRKRKSLSAVTLKPGSDPFVALKDMEKENILKVYNKLDQNKSQAAALLGIGINTLRRKLKSYGVG
ncbi:MAG: sigma-54-dependent Fis family transcriptional regulator [Desulfobacteraceae bacterium]|nr:MAG: sigma-54-dependent Fis family transcriptional regulator [Desulfobacteraceae bacterium]